MGSNNTTRRVVIENEEGSSVVQISDSAAKQLQNELESEQSPESPNTQSQANHKDTKDVSRAKELEEYYINKLKLLEERNSRLYQTTTQQFANAVEEVEHKFLKYSGSPVCQDIQEKVLKCYQMYPQETLRCSEIVQEFCLCVEDTKKNTLLSKTG